MPRFAFALHTDENIRRAGVVTSESFDDALALVSEHIEARTGDRLEIGVRGFPPARFECVAALIEGEPLWRPLGKLAA